MISDIDRWKKNKVCICMNFFLFFPVISEVNFVFKNNIYFFYYLNMKITYISNTWYSNHENRA